MKAIRSLIVCFLFLALTGCNKDEAKTAPADNDAVAVPSGVTPTSAPSDATPTD